MALSSRDGRARKPSRDWNHCVRGDIGLRSDRLAVNGSREEVEVGFTYTASS